MGQVFRASGLVPRSSAIKGTICGGSDLLISIGPPSKSSRCPVCGVASGRIHSRYRRHLSDLAVAGRRPSRLEHLIHHLAHAKSNLVVSFANGISKDQAAVSAAITTPWSNGQTEDQITKLKRVKRQICGRGKLDLLQARVIVFP